MYIYIYIIIYNISIKVIISDPRHTECSNLIEYILYIIKLFVYRDKDMSNNH